MARAVLIDLMCLASEGVPHGYLADRHGPLSEKYMAGRCVLSAAKFRGTVAELLSHARLHQDGQTYFIKRMVRDEEIRQRRAAGGSESINHPKVPKKDILPVVLQGNPHISRDARSGALPSAADSESSVCSGVGLSGKGLGFDPESIDQVCRWMYEFMGEEWPYPDVLVGEQVLLASNGAPLEKIGQFMRQLRAQGKRPTKSWVWFIGVVREHFGRHKHGDKAAV